MTAIQDGRSPLRLQEGRAEQQEHPGHERECLGSKLGLYGGFVTMVSQPNGAAVSFRKSMPLVYPDIRSRSGLADHAAAGETVSLAFFLSRANCSSASACFDLVAPSLRSRATLKAISASDIFSSSTYSPACLLAG
jgi:hypothetical protein